ncbi:hypothetical protein IPM09_04740 [Candidatus Saccharibacteria bacterium]|nr:MAG: hypothetical protein IPM09_04740 [Candidatus Saccharibacteria bacterium]
MKRLCTALVLATMSVTGLVIAPPVAAIDLFKNCTDSSCNVVKDNKLDYANGASGVWQAIRVATGILGLVSVLMIVIGGIKYAVSGGDSSGTKSAKDTILYAVIGLVVALIGQAVVLLVTKFFG